VEAFAILLITEITERSKASGKVAEVTTVVVSEILAMTEITERNKASGKVAEGTTVVVSETRTERSSNIQTNALTEATTETPVAPAELV
jgi:hypothetical protein